MTTLRQAGLCIAFILSGPTCDAEGEQVVKVMDGIVIPRVSLEKAPLEEAVDFARFKSVEFDPSPAPYKGVGIIICHPQKREKPDTETGGPGDAPTADPGSRTITYTAKKVTLTTLLIEIAKQAQLDLHITTVAIVFCSPGQQPFPNDYAENDRIVRTLYKVRPTVPAKPADKAPAEVQPSTPMSKP
jgi:hypothetical protein